MTIAYIYDDLNSLYVFCFGCKIWIQIGTIWDYKHISMPTIYRCEICESKFVIEKIRFTRKNMKFHPRRSITETHELMIK